MQRLTTRVAVVADSPMFRAGLEAMLGADPNVVIVGAVAESHDAGGSPRDLVADLDADVVVWVPSGAGERASFTLDDDAGDGSGDGALASPAVVLLADLAADAARRALRQGVRALLPLDAAGDEVLAAVHAAAAGLVTLPSDLLSDLFAVATPAASPAVERATEPATPTTLTPREREVLALLAQGLANKSIAPRLGISEHTVKAHVAAIYEKLHAGNRAEAVVAAARAGLLLL